MTNVSALVNFGEPQTYTGVPINKMHLLTENKQNIPRSSC